MPGPSPTAEPTRDLTGEVLDVVRTILTELIGAENLIGVSIGPDTAFDADLEMDSLEFVALAEQLRLRYGDGLDFIAWLADLDFDQIVALRVGDLVAFVVSSLAAGTS